MLNKDEVAASDSKWKVQVNNKNEESRQTLDDRGAVGR